MSFLGRAAVGGRRLSAWWTRHGDVAGGCAGAAAGVVLDDTPDQFSTEDNVIAGTIGGIVGGSAGALCGMCPWLPLSLAAMMLGSYGVHRLRHPTRASPRTSKH